VLFDEDQCCNTNRPIPVIGKTANNRQIPIIGASLISSFVFSICSFTWTDTVNMISHEQLGQSRRNLQGIFTSAYKWPGKILEVKRSLSKCQKHPCRHWGIEVYLLVVWCFSASWWWRCFRRYGRIATTPSRSSAAWSRRCRRRWLLPRSSKTNRYDRLRRRLHCRSTASLAASCGVSLFLPWAFHHLIVDRIVIVLIVTSMDSFLSFYCYLWG